MKLGIMQPYFIPYIGYWQLMNAVDKYVVYDDVHFIKGGWINRNRILIEGNPGYLNVPMKGSSPNKLINEIEINCSEQIIFKNLRKIENAYKRAPYFNDVYPLVEEIVKFSCENIASYIIHSFHIICDYLDIKTELIISSDLRKHSDLKGQDKVLEICEKLGATEYYNAIGGRALYSDQEFNKRNITLRFLKTDEIKYVQFENKFQANLSIVDVMMFNSVQQVQDMLGKYVLMSENEAKRC